MGGEEKGRETRGIDFLGNDHRRAHVVTQPRRGIDEWLVFGFWSEHHHQNQRQSSLVAYEFSPSKVYFLLHQPSIWMAFDPNQNLFKGLAQVATNDARELS